MRTNYTPQPMDTSAQKLPEELETLVEKMAKNVHEIWAQTRINQGWTYGEVRNDELKQHPCLIPYEELTEEFPGSIITRAHYAQLLLKKGYTKSLKEAFERYIGDNSPYFLTREKGSPADAIRLIKTLGGVRVLAHPVL